MVTLGLNVYGFVILLPHGVLMNSHGEISQSKVVNIFISLDL